MSFTVSIIGSGNIAFHLSNALDASGIPVAQIISRNAATGKELADALGAGFSAFPGDILPIAEIVLICVPDDQVPVVAAAISGHEGLVVHTSGSVGLTVLEAHFSRCGVLYPLQSFSGKRSIPLAQVPFCIEGNTALALQAVMRLAKNFSEKIVAIPSEKRLVLHLAAVLANNFSNQLYVQAAHLLKKHQLDFDLLKPLILETAAKVQYLDPEAAQTGPARRKDNITISRHLALLESEPELKQLYVSLTEMISHR